MFKVRYIWDVGCSGGEMFVMSDVWNVGSL